MIFYYQKDFQGQIRQKVEDLVGLSFSFKDQWRNGSSGSSLFRLRESKLNDKLIDNTHLNLRCNFERRTNGLILRINQSQKLSNLAIDYASIDKIIIGTGQSFHLGLLNPIRLFLKLGLSEDYIRFFPHRMTRYQVRPLNLIIKTTNGILRFDANGFSFRNTLKYFEQTDLKDKIEIINEKPTYNTCSNVSGFKG